MARVLLIQLGSPTSPKVGDVRAFLREFLGDPRVVDGLPPLVWKLILWTFVLPLRPFASARAYRRIWDGHSFPLVAHTKDFARAVGNHLKDKGIQVDCAFLLSSPRLAESITDGPTLVVPLFPQYSESTTASVFDALAKGLARRTLVPPLRFVTHFHTSAAFVDNCARQIRLHLERHPADALVLSFHGIPKRRVLFKGDPYHRHCVETFELIRSRLGDGIPPGGMHISFQSRFGAEEWLTPYTDELCLELVASSHKRLAVSCPSFVADCLETIDEIGHELATEVAGRGGRLSLVPCLNSDPDWCRDFAQWIEDQVHLEERQTNGSMMPEVKMENPPLDAKTKKTLGIVFLTLFLDLVGFSIIFPLFPALAEYYLSMDAENPILRFIFESANVLTGGNSGGFASIVLFGGALGALYSLLQFLAAPIWGVVSDRIGRKPVLIISMAFLALSYGIWFFAGTFTLLVLGRFIGGIMSGNISTATAVVADITAAKNRSRGMAIIGIAFATGFIIGPALGGLLSMIDLTILFPGLQDYGVNPFSAPAALAFLLCLVGLYLLWMRFEESLPPQRRGASQRDRTVNPLVLFHPLPIPGVNLTNFGHFLFLCAFSGMEFTLTFLAVERFSYTAMDNAYIFIFVGVIIAVVQGGYVRRKAHQVGERKMALWGLLSILPGLICLGLAQNPWLLYGGLFFLAVGSALVIPTLTSLISLYSPEHRQGLALGVFRSLGALARVVGPIAASLIYWKYGSGHPYFWGAALMLVPIVMVALLPVPPHRKK